MPGMKFAVIARLIRLAIRDYGLERLDEGGEAAELRRRHAEWFLALVEEAEPHLDGAAQVEWLARLEEDVANIRDASGQPAPVRWQAACPCPWIYRRFSAWALRRVEPPLPQPPPRPAVTAARRCSCTNPSARPVPGPARPPRPMRVCRAAACCCRPARSMHFRRSEELCETSRWSSECGRHARR